MFWFINYLRGYLEVEITGVFPERFLNACAQNGVDFWGVRRVDKTNLRACIRHSGWKELEEESVVTSNEVTIVAKRGLPYKLWRVRHRTFLLGGCVAALITLFILSQFIWEIDIVGNDRVSERLIRQRLEEVGVKPGTYSPSVDLAVVKNKMLLNIDDLSWLTVNIKGSRATVEVRERIPKPSIIPLDEPCNIVAAKDGVVMQMDTLEGSAQVTRGETVKKGQLLVSGIIDSQTVGARFLHAQADVRALTWYDITAKMPRKVTAKQYTGRTHKKSILVWNKKRIPLGFSSFPNYACYDKMVTSQTLTLPFDVVLPVSLVTEEYVEYLPVTATVKEDTALARMEGTLESYLSEQMYDAEVRVQNLLPDSDDGAISVRLSAECFEQIAQAVELPR